MEMFSYSNEYNILIGESQWQKVFRIGLQYDFTPYTIHLV